MSLHGSTNTRVESEGCLVPPEVSCGGLGHEVKIYLISKNVKHKNGKFKRKAGPAIGPRGSPPALYISCCHTFETLQEGD